ncbi:3-dehydroquinate synthase [Ancylomarina sp. 16SWW S1-10-2]|uniref:3-dehydroquinate synthase n=1 Tax=Ancylomarina sp. 16SWW S1-10-2 TaxID=2499681 RepID=UPI0012AE0876|nr:3-dehydroquinate synthase [Ancylomarina sp. 16SWW S1-10-2]MRT94151.1 3-dehydroquinate synthase [Ancylomarina sp. 16SWW S1-10-2]
MSSQSYDLIFTENIEKELDRILDNYSKSKIFILMDSGAEKYCWHLLSGIKKLQNAPKLIIENGEQHKSLDSVVKAWQFLGENGANRHSLVINIGGGIMTDLGGFVASTFKRGCNFMNIPTTLLAQIDASVGGKTGFNFEGLKNEIGVINQPNIIIVSPEFLKTLPLKEFKSGFAEMLKHAIIYSQNYLDELFTFKFENINYSKLLNLIRKSVAVKQEFVTKDPTEKNIRKVLNFGHTIGHAFESFAHRHKLELYHGEAVVLGMIGELYLSVRKQGFPQDKYEEIVKYITDIYTDFPIFAKDYPEFYQFMLHDKKNSNEGVNFTLLQDIGSYTINNICTEEEIFEALNQYGKKN